jgi:CRP-like cAMP-binding protein
VIVLEDTPGQSMFLVRRGRVAVTLGAERRRVAVIESGGYFGEMSLLTGDPRTATVIAEGDTEVLEIDAAVFAGHIRQHPDAVDEIAARAEARRRELDANRASGESPETARVTLARRMRNFLRL